MQNVCTFLGEMTLFKKIQIKIYIFITSSGNIYLEALVSRLKNNNNPFEVSADSVLRPFLKEICFKN